MSMFDRCRSFFCWRAAPPLLEALGDAKHAAWRLWWRVPAPVRRPVDRCLQAIARGVEWCVVPFVITRCIDCERLFDRRDPRAFVRRQWGRPRLQGLNACPACRLQRYEGLEVWAVTNDCNGIFDDMIFSSREEARQKAASFDLEIGMYAVPARVYEEDDWLAIEMRNIREDADEALWARQAAARGDVAS